MEDKDKSDKNGKPPKKRARCSTTCSPFNHKHDLWVDEWAPRHAQDIIGHRLQILQLNVFLLRFVSHLRQREYDNAVAEYNRHSSAKDKNQILKNLMSKNAILLSGSSGIGKTTLAKVVSQDLGFDIVELNASDVRNKSTFEQCVTTNRTFFRNKPFVLVLDEVDGMSGNSDRGGISAMIKMIESSKAPVLCICNDRFHPKLKSLLSHCVDMRIPKLCAPFKNTIAQVLHKKLGEKNIRIDISTLETLIEAQQNDVRSTINTLQMLCVNHNNPTLDLMQKETQTNVFKNVELSGFALAEQFFCKQQIPIAAQKSHFFSDYDMMPLFVQENYCNYNAQHGAFSSSINQVSDHERLDAMCQASDFISLGDTCSQTIRCINSWDLLNDMAVASCIAPGAAVRGKYERLCDTDRFSLGFPKWLGKNSTMNKNKRLLSGIMKTMNAKGIHTGKELDVVSFVLPSLCLWLTNPLIQASAMAKQDASNKIDESCFRLASTGLSRQDFDTIHSFNKFSSDSLDRDIQRQISTHCKSLFTKRFNKDYGKRAVSRFTFRKGAQGRDFDSNENHLKDDEQEQHTDNENNVKEEETTQLFICGTKRKRKNEEKKKT